MPVDISTEMLAQEAARASARSSAPHGAAGRGRLHQPFRLPAAVAGMPRIGFFPGSTIGNFEPHEACAFLRHAGRILGRGATLIIGVDLVKDAKILNAAYDDPAGRHGEVQSQPAARASTASSMATFDLEGFSHEAFYNSERHRIEMHLASKKRQKVRVAGRTDRFPRRRDDPHREQLQIHARILRRAGARVGMDAGRRCGPTRRVFLGPGAGRVEDAERLR